MAKTNAELQKDVRVRRKQGGEVSFERRVTVAEKERLDAYLKRLRAKDKKTDEEPVDDKQTLRYNRSVMPEQREKLIKYLDKLRKEPPA